MLHSSGSSDAKPAAQRVADSGRHARAALLPAALLAAAAAMLAAMTLLTHRPDNNQPQFFVAGFLLVIVGSLLGFLWHNRPPAQNGCR